MTWYTVLVDRVFIPIAWPQVRDSCFLSMILGLTKKEPPNPRFHAPPLPVDARALKQSVYVR